MMELVRKTNSTYNQIDRNLRILVKEGIVKVNQYGRVKIIRLDRENEKTLILLKALYILNKPITNS